MTGTSAGLPGTWMAFRPRPQPASHRGLDELAAGALPICCLGSRLLDVDGRAIPVPILHVAAEGRPDVRDLVRAIRADGASAAAGTLVGTTCSTLVWADGVGHLVIEHRQAAPVACTFALHLSGAEHAPILAAIARSGGGLLPGAFGILAGPAHPADGGRGLADCIVKDLPGGLFEMALAGGPPGM
jgi:hypothetical protein